MNLSGLKKFFEADIDSNHWKDDSPGDVFFPGKPTYGTHYFELTVKTKDSKAFT